MCNGTTGLITNGSGGYGNSMNMINGGGNGGAYVMGAGVTTADINDASNSYMTPSGTTTVLANPNLPAVSEDLCNSIKCGATSADDLTKYACSQTYGAGVWDLCGDARCTPYRGSSCAPKVPSTSIVSSSPQAQPLTPASLTQPVPDITSVPSANTATTVGPDLWCSAAQWVNNNPVMAVGVLVAAFLAIKGGK